MSWLHGHIPWWNPYEGLGAPLAGEMQAGAFFPPVLLLALPWGFPVVRILLEMVAGGSTYFLVRRLGVGRAASAAGGIAFGLTGTLAWLQNAPANPVAFLPLALLGVERARQAALEGRRGGWGLVAIAVALSGVSGFPEVAYLDTLLVVAWSVARVATIGSRWRAALGKLAAGGITGAMLAAPALVAFLDFLQHADTGAHNGALSLQALAPQNLPQLLLPYAYGPIFAVRDPSSILVGTGQIWDSVGGYLDATLVAAALAGFAGAFWVRGRRRGVHPPSTGRGTGSSQAESAKGGSGTLVGLRIVLGAWIFLGLAGTFDLGHATRLFAVFPDLGKVAFARYSAPSWEMATVLLAVIGVDDALRGSVPRWVLGAAAACTGVLSLAAAASAWGLMSHATSPPHAHAYVAASAAWALGALSLLSLGSLLAARTARGRAGARRLRGRAGARRLRGRAATLLAAGAMAIEAAALFAAPQLSAPTPQPVDTGLTAFLQRRLGTARFSTLGPISPNFGSYFGISELNVNDLPVPSAFAAIVRRSLDPDTDPLIFTGTTRYSKSDPGPGTELSEHVAAYEGAGVRYVVVPASGLDASGEPWPARSSEPHGAPSPYRLAYSDTVARVYELPEPEPLYHVAGGSCTVEGQSLDTVEVTCSKPSLLVRTELFMPGWRASVGDRPVRVKDVEGGVEGVSVPSGTSLVEFSFFPPREDLGIALLVLGAVALAVGARSSRLRLPRVLRAEDLSQRHLPGDGALSNLAAKRR
jgi:hypothetical protein